MERKFVLAPGEYYHIYNRGVEKRKIFFDEADRNRFLRLLFLSNGSKPFVYKSVQGRPLDEIDVGKKCVAVGAYVLMPNHFHILIKEIEEGGATTFMEKLQTGYSMYFNKKNERVGPLFQGRFKAEHIARDEHLKYLFAYIHLNPVKLLEPQWRDEGIQDMSRAERYIGGYRYSSYLDYAGNVREEKSILSPEIFPEYFAQLPDFTKYIKEWLIA